MGVLPAALGRRHGDAMALVVVPVDRLSREALDGLIEEFVTRDGTDYGEQEPFGLGRLAAVLGPRESRRMARRTREIWRNLIGQYERGGKKLDEFAGERGIPVGTVNQV